MKMYTKTTTPGLYRTPKGYALNVKATAKARDGSLKTAYKRKQLPGATEAEATLAVERLKQEAQREVDCKARGETTTTTVTAYAVLWTEALGVRLAKDQIARSTADTHRRNLDVFILPLLGRMEMSALTPRDIVNWLPEVAKLERPEWRRGRGTKMYKQAPEPYAKATLANAWRSLRLFLTWATVQADLARNPARDVRWDRDAVEHSPDDKVRVWLDVVQLTALLRSAMVDADKSAFALILLSLSGALRPSESTALNRDNLDLDNGVATICKSHSRGTLRKTKTRGSRRTVHLLPVVVDALRQHIALQDANNAKGVPILFPTSIGTRSSSATINDMLRRVYLRAGLTDHVTAYALRRSSNNLLRQACGDLVAMAVTGHVTTTMLAHYSDVDHSERLSSLKAAFGPALETVAPVQPFVIPASDDAYRN